YLSDLNDEKNPSFKIKTRYAEYKVHIVDGERLESENKQITIGRESIDSDPLKIKYFIRRQFIADEELFNLYLRRGKEVRPHEAQEKALASLDESRKNGADRALAILATGLGK